MRTIKVASHIHSEWSYDGSWSLPALARSFRRRGVDAMLMSEHDRGFDQSRWQDYQRACAAASSPDLLLVPGIEYGDTDDVVHIPVWGAVPFLGSDGTTACLLQRACSAGGFTVFAHPWRRDAWQRLDQNWLPHLQAVEVWNRKYDGWAPNSRAVQFADRHGVRPFVSLDFHTRRQFFPLSLAMTIDGGLTRDAVHAALTAGHFQPRFLSTSALMYTGGLPARVLTAVEAARRQAARRLGHLRQ